MSTHTSPNAPIARRAVTRSAAWSLPVIATAAAAPIAAASETPKWHLEYAALDPTYGSSTTKVGFTVTNTAAPPAGTRSDPVSGLTSVQIYTNTWYASEADAQAALDAAIAQFTSDTPGQGPSDPSGAATYTAWSQAAEGVFPNDNGDGTWAGSAIYQSTVSIPTGIAAGQSATSNLTVPVLANGFLTWGVVSPNSPSDPGGANGDDVQLFDQGDVSPGVAPLARGAVKTVKRRGRSPQVRAWFRAQR